MRGGKLRCSAALLLLVLGGALASAQTAPAELRLISVFNGGGSFPEADRALYHESLVATLLESNPSLTIVLLDEEIALENRQRLEEAAEAAGTHGWAAVSVELRENEISVHAQVRSVSGGEEFADLAYSVQQGASLRTLGRRLWGPIADAVADRLSDFSPSGELTLRGEPGTVVRDRENDQVGVLSESGELSLELPQPATYRFHAAHGGFYPRELEVFLQGASSEVELDLAERSSLVYNWYLQSMSYPGFDLNYMFDNGFGFLRAGGYSYNFGVVPFGQYRDSEERQLVFSEPLTVLHLFGGSYLHDVGSWFRGYAAGGLFLRLVNSGEYTGVEPVVPGGVELILGAELRPEHRFRAFFEYTPSIGRAAKPESLGAHFTRLEGIRPFAAGEMYVDVLNFRLGVRYQP